MFAGNPLQFAAENVRLIHHNWNGVRDGDSESIHQARIATRRVRAALKMMDRDDTERLELCRRLGRMLGTIRRERIRAACDYCTQIVAAARRRWSVALTTRALAAAGVVAVPVAMSRLVAGREGSHA
jgi:CHAD domain-containing protein